MNLFGRPANWFSIPAGRPFLRDLAGRLFETLGPGGEDSLAQSVILLPNRRGARALSQAFVEASGQRALLLPQIRALGDLDEGEPPFEAGDLAIDLAPAISPWRRRFELSRLVQDYLPRLKGDFDGAAAFELADALGAFFDSLEIEEITDRDRIATLVEADLAEHWRDSASFLALAVQAWPQRLEALGLSDPATRRVALLRRLADKWESAPPAFPVIAAGSTGSVKSTAALLSVIARSPRGCVVLPGLDQNLADEAWDEIEPQHPQYSLKRLLEHAQMARGDVSPWPIEDTAPARWRRRVINEALRPASATGDWYKQIEALNAEAADETTEPVRTGLDGLHVLTARAEEDAAGAAAVLLRETLETPGTTAALVTPDQDFARRVSARLARWGVAVDSSAGIPLADTPVGILLGLLAQLAADPDDPVVLLAILKHPMVRLGLESGPRDAGCDRLERYALRGRRPREADEVMARLLEKDQQTGFAESVYAQVEPVRAAFSAGDLDASAAARLIGAVAESLCLGPQGGTGGLWAGAAGEAAAGLLAALMEDGGLLGAMPAERFARLTDRLMQGETVRAAPTAHPRLQILGAIEARLVHADRIILAGLEEGVWPPNAPTDPFLSRPMRQALGLPSPERRIGLSAHDFVQLASAPDVYLIHARRRAGQPTVKSRWLWRLETLARGAGVVALPGRDEVLAWASALDEAAGSPAPAPRPAPRPPVADRPRALSVTQVETLTRDPYAVWAKHILHLRALDRPDREADALVRGSAIHSAFETFSRFWPAALPADAAGEFCKLYVAALRDAGMATGAMAREEALAREAAAWVADWEAGRRQTSPRIEVEVEGSIAFETPGGRFTLSARADRIELTPDGTGHILDFKTGGPPSPKQVKTGFSPQLTLTAAILIEGGFPELSAKRIGDLVYVSVTGRKPAGKETPALGKDGVAADAIADARIGLQTLIGDYDDPKRAYVSRIAPAFVRTYDSDYDHLARVYEWATAAEDGGDE